MEPQTLPTRVDEIDPTWLTGVLRRRGGLATGRVARCRPSPLGTQGMTSETYRLELDYDGADPRAPRTLIAKLASADPATRARMHALGLYERELRFYAELARATELRTPACHFAGEQPETGAFVLLLDEVTGEPGVPTLDALEQVLRDIAKLHAHYWNAPELDAYGWLEHAPAVLDAIDFQLRGIGERVAQRTGAALPAAFAEAIAIAALHLPALRAAEKQRPRTVVHGDLHPGQIITTAGGPVVFDWQSATIASPGRDVARVIAMTLPPTPRRRHEHELLATYRAALERHGVRGYSTRDCFDDYRRGLVATALINAFAIAELDEAKLQAPPAAVTDTPVLELLVDHIDRALRENDALALLQSDVGERAAAA